MKLTLATKVNGNYKTVMDGFDQDLFEALKPPVGKMEVVEFTGSETGDTVHLRFLSPVKANWVSKITDHGVNETQAWFIDEGVELPKPLNYWHHKHIVEKDTEVASIIWDKITYKTGFWLLDICLFPMLFLSFFPRKKIYRQYFKQEGDV